MDLWEGSVCSTVGAGQAPTTKGLLPHVVTAGVRVDSRCLLWISPVLKTEASRYLAGPG